MLWPWKKCVPSLGVEKLRQTGKFELSVKSKSLAIRYGPYQLITIKSLNMERYI